MVIRVCCDVHRLFPQKLAPDHVRDACSNPRALLLDLPLTQQQWPLDWNWGIWLDNYISLTFWPRWRTPIGDHKSLTVKYTSEWEKLNSCITTPYRLKLIFTGKTMDYYTTRPIRSKLIFTVKTLNYYTTTPNRFKHVYTVKTINYYTTAPTKVQTYIYRWMLLLPLLSGLTYCMLTSRLISALHRKLSGLQ